ncbi:Mercuric resistance operon regulatory protein [Roseivivax sp. THAF40]|jgi:DNA-binding transcriptional MerR regulator|uniref:MerR family transcriptional regulator n=1 Tax=unclassified Roseivivax TaxID=2639302 RepID=UPI0012681683|nr:MULTISPECIES: helix-turn-helix domain-containing protein [unclassified Roseivivax]QFS82925.1 Mercuric resistance operon regulatory protein [Roseivivax sp. THAF197b]QFT46695.1 Mercuric resistance operon regulatory protein [Roseivivax sp. THAF40]
MKEYSIGQMSRQTGVKVTTIRYYESRGLIPSPARTEGGQRRYDEAALERLAFLRHSRELGFGLDDIADLMALAEAPSEDCAPAHEIARKQLAAVDRRMTILAQLREELVRMAHVEDPGHAGECRVIEVLGNHRLCMGTHDLSDASANLSDN